MTTVADGAELLTVPEMGDYLRVARATIQRWCHDGTLPAVKIGKAYRIRRSDLDRWYASKRVSA